MSSNDSSFWGSVKGAVDSVLAQASMTGAVKEDLRKREEIALAPLTWRFENEKNESDESDQATVEEMSETAGVVDLAVQPRQRLFRTSDEVSEDIRRKHISSGYLDLSSMRLQAHASKHGLLSTSLSSCHNETGNIYTHLVPAAIALPVLVYDSVAIAGAHPHSARVALLQINKASVLAMLLCSALYHIGRTIYPERYAWLIRLDYCGIVLMIAGCFICAIYCGFECHPFWRDVYLYVNVALQLLNLAICCVWYRRFSETFQKWTMVISVAAGLIPTAHWLAVVKKTEALSYGYGIAALFLIYALAFVVYNWRFPEAFWPNALFDYAFHSHQIWHILLCVGAWVWVEAINAYVLFRVRHGTHSCTLLKDEPTAMAALWKAVFRNGG